MIGPIMDTQGMEQGGCASDNEQLQTANQSELGVDLVKVITAKGDHIRQLLSAAVMADMMSYCCLHLSRSWKSFST